MLSVATLFVVPQSVNILSVIRMSAAILKVIMLNATMVSVAMIKVIQCTKCHYSKRFWAENRSAKCQNLSLLSASFTSFLPEFRTR